MNECPQCQKNVPQVKAGTTSAGSHRLRCTACRAKPTPDPKQRGYPPATRQKVVQEYVDGGNLRRIARQFGVVHQTVANWVAAHADTLPDQPPQPLTPSATAELDELYTFSEAIKRIHDRESISSMSPMMRCPCGSLIVRMLAQ